jgi:hypothetical protein
LAGYISFAEANIMNRIALLATFILLLASPAFAGKVFGNLKEGGRSVGSGVEVQITCGGRPPITIKTDDYGAYSTDVPPGMRCQLKVNYSNQWTDPAFVVSSNDPARYDFELVNENGRYVLKRR